MQPNGSYPGEQAMGRIRKLVKVDSREFWTLFDTGARNTCVVPEVAHLLTTSRLPRPIRIALGGEVKQADTTAPEYTEALIRAGLTTPQKMAAASWQERVDVITWHGYKRYDESTSTMLGDTATLLLDRYQGDLRKLREEADRDVRTEKRLLQAFKGIGEVGADIFLREVQVVWDEAYPYADRRVLDEARRLRLGKDAAALTELVPRADYPSLVAGLVRVSLNRGIEDSLRA
jgi:hypothetical protein